MALTPKQEKYIHGLVEGKSQRLAYREAYPNNKMTDDNVDSKASALFADVRIRARYQELLDETKKNAVWTREMAIEEMKWLKDKAKASIEVEGVRQANSNAFVNSVKELNTLGDVYPKDGEGASQETEVADTLKKLVDHFAAN